MVPDMSNYYISKPGATTPQGPMSLAQVQAGVANGTITPDYYCCVEGGQQWMPVSSVANAPAMPAPGGMPVGKPDNQLVWSILVLLFCCLPSGIYSIIKSCSVDGLWMNGQHAAAHAAAAEAKKWNIIGASVGVVFTILYLALCVVAGIMEA